MSAYLQEVRSRLDRALGRRDALRIRLASLEADVLRLEAEESLADLSANLIRTLVDNEVTEGVQAVEELLTEGLAAVFEDQDLSVRAEVDVQRGKVSVDFLTVQKHADGTVTSGLCHQSFGGAVTTVQSVLLRMIITLRRGLRPVLFLDETLPAFDANYVHSMGRFLGLMCERLGFDVLLVSHNEAMVEAADRAYRIHKVDGAATFRLIR